MQRINSLNADGNTPMMVLLLPPASVDYDNADSAKTIDTPVFSAEKSFAEKTFDQDQLSKAQKLVPYSILNHLKKIKE